MNRISRRQAMVVAVSAVSFAVLAGQPVLVRQALAADFPAAAQAFIERSAAQARSEAPQAKASGDARVRFARLFAQSFDVDALARATLGSRWTALNPTQQREFRTAFEAYVAKAYADRFYTYAGQPMTVVAAEPAANGQVLVRTRVQMPGSANQTPVDWQVSQIAGAPRISDVTIDGVSLTRTQRDEFASVIQANGGDVTKLTAMLEQRSR
ncbi:MAG: toluene tolerance protein [Alphaproteobacteria bacterium]|nr:toluene tolerance protein [Alphaproteobacteria bacterium]